MALRIKTCWEKEANKRLEERTRDRLGIGQSKVQTPQKNIQFDEYRRLMTNSSDFSYYYELISQKWLYKISLYPAKLMRDDKKSNMFQVHWIKLEDTVNRVCGLLLSISLLAPCFPPVCGSIFSLCFFRMTILRVNLVVTIQHRNSCAFAKAENWLKI